ncbi:MAG: hypothetical protein CENE_03507 [Candidatus Celerinatantimonas neptuna]|nr:MAG: hypothetical protein CENE_03507 [Candidatus Celerinatantimonas neptuna]
MVYDAVLFLIENTHIYLVCYLLFFRENQLDSIGYPYRVVISKCLF